MVLKRRIKPNKINVIFFGEVDMFTEVNRMNYIVYLFYSNDTIISNEVELENSFPMTTPLCLQSRLYYVPNNYLIEQRVTI